MITKPFFKKQAFTLTDEVINAIVENITGNRWPAGFKIPSEIELAEMFSVSQGTVRRSLQYLVNEGLLIRHQGKGTFVMSRKAQTVSKRKQWFAKIGDEDDPNRTPRICRITGFERVAVNPKFAELLEVEPGSFVYHIQRECTYKGLAKICCFDDIYLPQSLFPRLTLSALTEQKYPDLYAFYEDKCGVSVLTFDEQVKAALLNPEQAAKAQVPVPYPAVYLRRISRDASGRPIELRFFTNVTDEQSLVLSQRRCI